jgi:putative flippase GtrA
VADTEYTVQVNDAAELESAGHPHGHELPPGIFPEVAAAPPAGMKGAPGPLQRIIRDTRVLFLVVGATNTAIGMVWFVLFQYTIGAAVGEYGYLVTLGCAHVASVLCAFVLYRRFVFRVRGHVLRDLGRFELVYLVSIAINYALLPILVEFAQLPPIAAQALIVVVTTAISWFGHRGFSFRRSAKDGGTPA